MQPLPTAADRLFQAVLNSEWLGVYIEPKFEPMCPNFKTLMSQMSVANCLLLWYIVN